MRKFTSAAGIMEIHVYETGTTMDIVTLANGDTVPITLQRAEARALAEHILEQLKKHELWED